MNVLMINVLVERLNILYECTRNRVVKDEVTSADICIEGWLTENGEATDEEEKSNSNNIVGVAPITG